MKISEQIEKEKKKFSGSVLLIKGYKFNWHETVRRIMLYQSDRYLDRDDDDDAVFWNVVSPQSSHFIKNIDLDTKDFRPEGRGKTNFIQAWILKIKFKKWARESGLSKTINGLISNITNYGFAVWKKTPDEEGYTLDNCRLDKIYFDVLAKDIQNSPIIEEHELSLTDLDEKEDAWDDIEEAKKLKDENDKVKIFERVGKWEKKLMHHIVCGEGNKEIILFEEELKENIYYGFSLDNAKGRLPGIGIYERCFKIQERTNTLVNENAQTTAITSLLLLKSSDSDLRGNVLTDAISGQIFNTQDLEQIKMDNRALSGFLAELDRIEDHARKLCMTPEVVTGENLPSGTPFRSMAALTMAAKSAFKNTRDNIGSGIVDILIEQILPSLVKNWNKEELLEIADNDQDIKLYDEALVRYLQQKLLKERLSKKQYTTDEELAELSQKVLTEVERKGRKVDVEKGFFNFEYGIRINPTGENYDKAQQNDAYFNVITMISQNPALLNLPLVKQYLENNGINWWKLTPEEIETIKSAQLTAPTKEKVQTNELNQLK